LIDTASTTDILSKLNDECIKFRAFVVLLEDEQKALLGPHPEDLFPLAEAKTRLAENLSAIARERQQLLQDQTRDMAEWLNRHAPKGITLWQEIRQLAVHAQQLNQTNGELIQIKLRFNQQALNVLYSATQSAAGLYGPNGQTSLPSSGRILGSV
jgi:flagella synthesis protein FlgN